MRTHDPRALVAATLFLACGGAKPTPPTTPTPASAARPAAEAPAPPAPAPAAPEKLATDTTRTVAGFTFTAPAGWTLETGQSQVILTGPEPDLRLAIVASGAKGADEAVAAAWRTLDPGFKRPLKLAQSRPARNGWEEEHGYDYETSPNEKLTVFAAAVRRGDVWVGVACQSSDASVEKRLAGLVLLHDSLRPKGYAKESFKGRTANALDAARIERIGAFIDKGREEIGVPGVAISLVQGGKVVFAGGFGVKQLGKPAKVDADTLFIIASNTKALSTLLLATEADEGKFTWDTPVTQLYPAFKLGDADTTSRTLMKHLVCACTGLPRQDLEWIFEYKDATPKTEMALLATVQPTTKFGETFQYSNLLASAAGFIGGQVAYPGKELGAAYDEAMQRRIFARLGMKATTFDFARAWAGNHAWPHGLDIKGKTVVASMGLNRAIIPLRPAGGAWSSARDVTRYVQMELANGKLPDGTRLLSEEALLARRAPQVSIGEHTTYGMGLEVDTEFGVAVVHHGGDLAGFHSDMFWLPEYGVGGVILTNADGGWLLRRPFMRKLLEELFDGNPEAAEDVASSAKRFHEEIAKERERLVAPPAPEATAKLARRYTNASLGDVTVTRRGAAVTFDVGEWKSAVASRKNDDGSMSLVTIDPGVDGFQFVVSEAGGKRELVLRDAQHEYVFVEADAAARKPK